MIRHKEIWSAFLKYADKYSSDYTNEMYDIAGIEKAFKAGAEWVLNNLWKPADGDGIPEINMEVIVLTQSYPLEGNEYAVSFAHRPNPNGWDGKNVTTGEIEHYIPKTYGKSGWSSPDVKWWLDLDLPKPKVEE